MVNLVNSPEELKKMSPKELEQQAALIREFLISSISKTGGHIGSNLGVVELTMALHFCFDSPADKIIFDVGHQSYVHKILTGRADKFDTLRQYEGLSGFIKHNESEHDVWEAGHSSTSLSAAAGYAYARDLNGVDNHVIAVIGDGSLTNGMALEALNHIVELNLNMLIIVNDNEMSISPNIGFVDNILKDLRVSTEYRNTKRRVHKFLSAIPFGEKLADVISRAKHRVKISISSTQNFFNIMGYNYIGPVNGHSFDDLISSIEESKKHDGPKIIHVKTQKGRGYTLAEQNNWHGIGPFDPETGELLNKKSGLSYSGLVASHVANLMDDNLDITVITPAMLGGSELSLIQSRYPNRITDTGIAEEHALTFAASLTLANRVPFVAIYSTFLQRAYDQVFHDIARINAHVVIGVDRAGLVGEDGETHQGIYDIAFLSHMPNMTIVQGKDDKETLSLLNYAFNTHDGPIAVRYPRGGAFKYETNQELEMITSDSWIVEKEASEYYVITYGELVNECLTTLADLDIGVINARFIKPIDLELITLDKKYIVIEEHVNTGSLLSLIKLNVSFVDAIGINLNDEFVQHGDVKTLRSKYNLCGENLHKRVCEVING